MTTRCCFLYIQLKLVVVVVLPLKLNCIIRIFTPPVYFLRTLDNLMFPPYRFTHHIQNRARVIAFDAQSIAITKKNKITVRHSLITTILRQMFDKRRNMAIIKQVHFYFIFRSFFIVYHSCLPGIARIFWRRKQTCVCVTMRKS